MKTNEYTELGQTIDKLNNAHDISESSRLMLIHLAALKISDMRERLRDAENALEAKSAENEALKTEVRQLTADLVVADEQLDRANEDIYALELRILEAPP